MDFLKNICYVFSLPFRREILSGFLLNVSMAQVALYWVTDAVTDPKPWLKIAETMLIHLIIFLQDDNGFLH